MKKHILILGSGFGGMEVAKRLVPLVRAGEVDVTVVNRTNAFLFTPLLHEVATGGLSPASVAEPLREVFVDTGVRVVQGDVTSVDAGAKTVTVGACVLPYDIAVLASGATTNYYDTPGAEEFALALKTLDDALRMRERVIDAFEAAALTDDEAQRRALLSFVVVGAGATGVELVLELAEFAHGIADRYFDDRTGRSMRDDVAVTLVNAGAEVLAQFPDSARRAAGAQLVRRGVTVRSNAQVAAVHADGVTFADGTTLQSAFVAWTAGVTPQLPAFTGRVPLMEKGRVVVDAMLRAEGVDNLFVLGDGAAFQQDGAFLPMLAQVAVAQGKVVAHNVIATLHAAPLVPFRYRSRGALVSLGQWFAAGTVGPVSVSGRLAWWVWRTVYLFKFASNKKRVRIAFEWTLNLFSPRDVTKYR